MKNAILEKFRRGEPSLGIISHLLSAPAIEVLAYTGMDYVLIDLEHSPIGAEHAARLVGVAQGAGLAPLVRVDGIGRSQILKMLDVGAAGLVVPQLETVEQARKLVSYAKFPPLGNRGYCPTRDGGWGSGSCYERGMDGYMAEANTSTLLIPQCETAGCLEHIEEIAAVEGVDGIFIGPFDLSIALGIPGQFGDPLLTEGIERVRRACAAAGKLCIMYAGSGEAAKRYFDQGFPSVAAGLDIEVLKLAVRGIASAARP
ncbi:MAG TPA: hypothetical protein IAC81_03535 [Candidatus Scatomorpha stercorigallinarum]|nr:hypothetical protein [Candidatus Scatomorpha stercorigallinarum]